ncbi:MAG TPA: CopD family protein [Burkholderiales bacterium]|nr:CopD family protein [Burkholderiales bacterium]
MILAKFLHVLSVVIWVGGMFFAYMALRPVAAERLEPPQRLNLWEGVFSRFFPWVWLSVALILGSGLFMMARIGKPPVYVMAMFGLGVLMMLLYAHVFFAPFKRLKRAVSTQDWAAGGIALAQIRKAVGINLLLGLLTVAVATLGVYLG